MDIQPRHPLKGGFIVDLQPGQRIVGFFLVRHKQLEPFRDRSKGEFLTLILADRTGQMLARVWEGAAELADSFAESDVVKVAADVEDYLGRTQMIVQRLRAATADEFELADFLPATEKDTSQLLSRVLAAVDEIGDAHLGALVRHFYADADFRQTLTQAPAARRVHHAYLGGLLEYLAEVLAVCDALLPLYPDLSADLLRAGALLHVVGRLSEFSYDRDIDYTDEGRLVGHIVAGAERVTTAMAALPDFPEDLSLRVRHMLISQHGRYEWGSPRRPQTLEAIALHQASELVAQVSRFSALLGARREPGQAWTDYDRLLGRQLYAGQAGEPSSDEARGLE